MCVRIDVTLTASTDDGRPTPDICPPPRTSSYRSVDPQTLHGNDHQVDHVPNGPNNSAAITTMFPHSDSVEVSYWSRSLESDATVRADYAFWTTTTTTNISLPGLLPLPESYCRGQLPRLWSGFRLSAKRLGFGVRTWVNVCVSVSFCWTQLWALPKRPKRSRCRLGYCVPYGP